MSQPLFSSANKKEKPPFFRASCFFLLSVLTLTFPPVVLGATHVVVVPGKAGGGEDFLDNFPQFEAPQIHRVPLQEQGKSDLGQEQCQRTLRGTLEPLLDDKSIDELVIHATSQGSATVLNYLANESKNPSLSKIKAVILEACLANGNEVLEHTIRHNKLKWMPRCLMCCVMPCLKTLGRKWKLPLYNPDGQQPIEGIFKIPPHILFIILHAQRDPQIPYHNAQAVTVALKERLGENKGKERVHLFPIDSGAHHRIYKPDSLETHQIHQILKDNNLPYHEQMLLE